MTSLTFYNNIPAANNNPSLDQPKMLINNQSEALIWPVDHIGFGIAGSGTHEQTTFLQYATPATPSMTGSVAYPDAGIEDPSTAEYFFQNAKATLPLSAIRAFASFLTLAAPGTNQITPITSYNLIDTMLNPTGITQTSKNYTITLLDNVVFGNNIVVIPFISSPTQTISFTFTNPNLVITTSGSVTGIRIDFVILQI